MQLQIEELSTVEKRVSIEVSTEQVDAGFKQAYKQIAQRVRLPGFRRGKVPVSQLRKRYGRDASADVTQQLVQDGWRKALESFTPVAEPKIDAPPARQGKAFSFTITVEVVPEFDVKSYSELSIERERWTAGEAVVDHEIEHIAEQVASWEPVERTVAEEGDMSVIDFIGRIGGEIFTGGSGEDVELELGAGQFIPGFEAQIVGKTVGDTFDVTVTFPEQYQSAEFAGKEAVFETTLKDLKAKRIPELGDELAARLGEEDMDAVKKTVKERIEARYNERSDETAREAIRSQLEAGYGFDVPPAITKQAVNERARRLISEAVQSGTAFEEARTEADTKLEALRDEIVTGERGLIVLDAIAEAEDIKVSPQELMGFIDNASRGMGAQGAQYRQMFRDADRRAALRQSLRRQNTLDFLLTKANVTEIEKDVPQHDHSDDHAEDHEGAPAQD